MPPEIYYRHGLAVLTAVRETPPAWMDYDSRLEAWIAPGHRYPDLRRWAREQGVEERQDDPLSSDSALLSMSDARTLRPYQAEALTRWEASGGRGSVVLPTGAGKTLVALHAVHRCGGRAAVVAPTRALVGQWHAQLSEAFGAGDVGAWYGEEKVVRRITVTTYHSAFTLLERHGGAFELVVLDEVHHLADAASDDGGKAWHDALRIAPAARFLGLTATYPDGRDDELTRWVGPVVYRRRLGEMLDAELADLAMERRFIDLTPAERMRYDALGATYDDFIADREYRERFGTSAEAWWPVFMAETRESPQARRAHRAFRERERIVSLAEAKLALARRLLHLHPAERAILFCGSTAAAEEVSRRFAVPMITADTPATERTALLAAVERGDIRALAAVRVLDEGVDVPAAKLGIILGGGPAGGPKQHRQRLGRILRRHGERIASLFEIVAADSHELFQSQRRRKGMGQLTDRQLGLGL